MGNYEEEFDEAFDEADKKYKEKYKRAIEELKGLSEQELNDIAPNTTDKKVYELLISVVEDATAKNIALKEFKNGINRIGEIVKGVAIKFPTLKDILRG